MKNLKLVLLNSECCMCFACTVRQIHAREEVTSTRYFCDSELLVSCMV